MTDEPMPPDSAGDRLQRHGQAHGAWLRALALRLEAALNAPHPRGQTLQRALARVTEALSIVETTRAILSRGYALTDAEEEFSRLEHLVQEIKEVEKTLPPPLSERSGRPLVALEDFFAPVLQRHAKGPMAGNW